jgi:hypothetical protein
VEMKGRLIFVHIEFRSRWKCRSGRNWKWVPAETSIFKCTNDCWASEKRKHARWLEELLGIKHW